MLVAMPLVLGGCDFGPGGSTLLGGGLGAGVGALGGAAIGGAATKTGSGAGIGAVIGAGVGALGGGVAGYLIGSSSNPIDKALNNALNTLSDGAKTEVYDQKTGERIVITVLSNYYATVDGSTVRCRNYEITTISPNGNNNTFVARAAQSGRGWKKL